MSAAKSFLIAAVFAAAAFSGVAYAQNEVFTAKLAAPVGEQTRVIADNALWNCAGDTCVARPTHTVNVRACRQFAHQSGATVTAYGTPERQLSAEELARCNGGAQVQSAQN